MRLLLLVPDGVGVRNFLLEPCGSVLRKGAEVRVLTGFPAELLPESWQACAETMPAYREGAAGSFFRYSLAYAHLWRWDTPAMRFVRRMPLRGSWKVRALHAAARTAGRAMAFEEGIRVLEGALQGLARRRGEVQAYRKMLEAWSPDVILCTHQRPSIVLPVIMAAREMGIPTATFIFSWDNLTSKGRIAAPFEHFLVWSPLMKDELLRFYPDVDASRVHIVGTPQFDCYADRTQIVSREEFFASIGADPSRPLICYSGGDTTTCPNEPRQLAAVMELARKGAFESNPQWLFRPSPADSGERFTWVREKYPELLFQQPRWIYPEGGGWTHIIPTQDDVWFLTNLTAHADVNVNVASTMTLDFALRDKPVVNIGFDVDGEGGSRPWLDYYAFDHYGPVVQLGAARVARSLEELAEHVNAYLRNPSQDREGRKRLVELEVGAPVGTAMMGILAAVREIAAAEVTAR